MTDGSSRFARLLGFISLVRIATPLLALGALVGVFLEHRDASGWYKFNCVALAILTVGVIEVLLGAVAVLIKIESSVFRMHDVQLDLRDAATRTLKHIQEVAEQSRLSDVARSISSREQERDLIRRAFNESLIGGDFEAAYSFADQLENRHGYKQEAERMRRELTATRQGAEERYVDETVSRVHQLMGDHEWEKARLEIERLAKLYPNITLIQNLPELLRQKRTEQKRRLLKEWDESVQRNEIDRGISLLKELDQYLTPNEAAALEESARGVFRAKLHNLGVQFSLAVTEKQWTTALNIGQQIVTEFPNSRMAAEVREHLETLRTRATRAETVEA